tara:strand:- start:320 stop:619 length:300 start_codon:yes stop_codon:yes gene_type:complete
MLLLIESLTEETISLHIDELDTILVLKLKILDLTKKPVLRQRLFCQEEELANHRKIKDYGIVDKQELILLMSTCDNCDIVDMPHTVLDDYKNTVPFINL